MKMARLVSHALILLLKSGSRIIRVVSRKNINSGMSVDASENVYPIFLMLQIFFLKASSFSIPVLQLFLNLGILLRWEKGLNVFLYCWRRCL